MYNVHVDDLSSARIWHHKLCVTLSANVNINYRLPIKVYYRICTLRHIRIENKSWKPECVLSFNMGWRILVFVFSFNMGWRILANFIPDIRQPMLKLKTHSGFHELNSILICLRVQIR